jgi:hypothetical protein
MGRGVAPPNWGDDSTIALVPRHRVTVGGDPDPMGRTRRHGTVRTHRMACAAPLPHMGHRAVTSVAPLNAHRGNGCCRRRHSDIDQGSSPPNLVTIVTFGVIIVMYCTDISREDVEEPALRARMGAYARARARTYGRVIPEHMFDTHTKHMFDTCYPEHTFDSCTYLHIYSSGCITMHRPPRRSYPQAGRQPYRGQSGQFWMPRPVVTPCPVSGGRRKSTGLSTEIGVSGMGYPQKIRVIHRMYSLPVDNFIHRQVVDKSVEKLSTGCGKVPSYPQVPVEK